MPEESVKPAAKPCKYGCGTLIGWRNTGNRAIPLNPDGTEHTREQCTTLRAATEGKALPGRIIGMLTGYNSGSATFRGKDGMHTYAIDSGVLQSFKDAAFLIPPQNHPEVWLDFAIDQHAFVMHDWKVIQKPPWTADLKDPTGGEIKMPPQKTAEPLKETCTSPAAAPAPANPPLTNKEDIWSREREEFCNLLTSIGREGIQDLLTHLEKETDFFLAPSSTKYHDARDGGLLHHSLTVYRNLVMLSRTFAGDYPADSLIVIGLLHDLCKANFYKTSTRNVKKELPGGFSEWVKEPYIDIEDQFPLGHGEKSVILLQRYIRLTDEEIMAIRWHMMAYDDIRCSYAGNLAITNASGKFPIIVLTHIADLSASFLEVRKPETAQRVV